MSPDPQLEGAIVVCLSSIDWTFNWQIPQEVAAAFGDAGHRVLFVENTGVRRPAFRDARRVVSRLRAWWRARGRAQPASHGVDVWSPVLVPLPYSRLACRLNAWLVARTIRRWMDDSSGRPLVLLTFLPTPLVHALDRRLRPSLLVYYCADRLAASSAAATRLGPWEHALFARADLVFTTSHGLHQTAAQAARRAVLLTAGVRSAAFDRARAAGSPPAPLDGVRRPIVGFVGAVRDELDLALLARVARRAPDLTFVLVGPVFADTSALEALPNVRFVGPVPHDDAVRYMVSFDAGLLPYVLNAYTRDILPMKLKEYLAAGLPVVSTALPEVRRFSELHGAVVTFADSDESFIAAIRETLAADRPSAVAARRAVARSYDWSVQMSSMTALMARTMRDREAGETRAPRAIR